MEELQNLTWDAIIMALLVICLLCTAYTKIGGAVEMTRRFKRPREEREEGLAERQKSCEQKFRADQAALAEHGKRIDKLEEGQKVICGALHELLEHELHNGNAAAMKAASDNLFAYLNDK